MNQAQLNEFRRRAKQAGKTDAEINTFIQLKQNQMEAQSASPSGELFTPRQPEEPKKDGLLKSVAKSIASPFLKLGATADALSTSKILGGKGAENSIKNTPFGTAKPITSAREAAGVGLELASYGIGGGAVARGLKTAITTGIAGGAASGAFSGAGSTLQEGGATFGDTLRSGLTGAVAGGATGGLLPLVGKGLSKIIPSSFTIKSALTGVEKPTFQRIKNNPEIYDNALNLIAENPDKPFLPLASSISQRMKAGIEEAKSAYSNGIADIEEKLGTRGYNVSRKLGELAKPLKEFNLGLTLNRNGSARVFAKPQSAITNKQLEILSDLVDTVNQSKSITLRDVVDLGQKFQGAYDLIPLGVNGNPTKYHALVKALESKFDEVAESVVPALKPVNREYRIAKKVYDKFQSKFVDPNGELNQSAEQFLSNLLNLNKGQQQKAIRYLEEFTGIDIIDNVIVLKDAQKLNQLFPATGSRTQDILRSLLAKGAASLGTVASAATINPIGLAGSAAVVGATSPKIVGKASINAAKLAKKPITKAIGNIRRRSMTNAAVYGASDD